MRLEDELSVVSADGMYSSIAEINKEVVTRIQSFQFLIGSRNKGDEEVKRTWLKQMMVAADGGQATPPPGSGIIYAVGNPSVVDLLEITKDKEKRRVFWDSWEGKRTEKSEEIEIQRSLSKNMFFDPIYGTVSTTLELSNSTRMMKKTGVLDNKFFVGYAEPKNTKLKVATWMQNLQGSTIKVMKTVAFDENGCPIASELRLANSIAVRDREPMRSQTLSKWAKQTNGKFRPEKIVSRSNGRRDSIEIEVNFDWQFDETKTKRVFDEKTLGATTLQDVLVGE